MCGSLGFETRQEIPPLLASRSEDPRGRKSLGGGKRGSLPNVSSLKKLQRGARRRGKFGRPGENTRFFLFGLFDVVILFDIGKDIIYARSTPIRLEGRSAIAGSIFSPY